MNQSTFNETFAFFSDRLSRAEGVEEYIKAFIHKPTK